MENPLSSHTTGWITLAALLVFSPQIAGCDTSAPSERETKVESAQTQAKSQSAAKEESKSARKTPAADEQKKTEEKARSLVDLPEEENADTKDVDGAPAVKRLVIASDIEEREPVAMSDAKIKEPVVAFLELKNDTESDSRVVVTFEHEDGAQVGFIELDVPKQSPRYRTWGRTRNITETGQWTAVIKTVAGEELARKSFTVTG